MPAPLAKKRKTGGRSCGTCGMQGHTSGKCPDLESAAPDTPDPDIVVDAGQPIGVLDTEFSTAKKGEDTVVHEAALVVATYAAKKGELKFTGFLSNEVLFRIAEKRGMEEIGLTPHRALDDAKAERLWLTKLPAVKETLFGSSPRLPCGISIGKARRATEVPP